MSTTFSLVYKKEKDLIDFIANNNLSQFQQLFIQIFAINSDEQSISMMKRIITDQIPLAMVIAGETPNMDTLGKLIDDDEYLLLVTVFDINEWKIMLKKMNSIGAFYHLIEKSEEKIKQLNESLSVAEAEYKSLFENNSDFIFSTNLNGVFQSANPAFEQTLGYKKEELIGQKFSKFISDDDIVKVSQYFDEILSGNKLCFTINIPCKNGLIQVCQITIIPITKGGELTGIYGIGRNVTKQIEIENHITNLEYFDYDTGLPNRSKVTQEINSRIKFSKSAKREFAVIFIDIDRFKNINVSFGHYVGDIVLKELADRVKAMLPNDAFLGRFEGDKFCVIMNAGDQDIVTAFTNKILEVIYQPILYEDLDFFVTASVGVSLFPADGQTDEQLLKHADLAMHRSKDEGGNKVTFYCTDMNKQAISRMKIETYLRKPLENDEFFLVYQPLIDLENGEMFGSEALIRWNNPELGIVPPLHFIPIAEEVGVINGIGKWVLKTACKQNKKWHDDGLGKLTISVNVSPRQFQEFTFIEDVKEALSEADLEPQYLMLELTEGVMLNNIDYSIEIMRQLQALGVKISVDDFGTGYSALSYLKNLPIDSLKIDRSFINNIHTGNSDEAIVKAIITMGEGLEVRVVAEGVETAEQLSMLKELNCHYAQGYFIDRPLSATDFERLRKTT